MIASVEAFTLALQDDFNNQCLRTDSTPCDWPNASFVVPEPSVLWVRFRILWGTSFQADLGTPKRFRHPGVLSVGIFAPLHGGEATEIAFAASIVARYTSADRAGAQFGTATALPGRRDGARWFVPVECPFFADRTV